MDDCGKPCASHACLIGLFFCALLMLAGCAGPASKTAQYTPPNTPGGRMCSGQCGEARGYCRETCDLTQRTCVNKSQAQAIQDYEKYTREQFFSHEPADLQPRDFERNDKCRPDSCYSDCESSYQTCYESCGGKVSITTSCQFLCF